MQTKTPTEICSYAVIALSLACLTGLGLGHTTGQSMHARLSASPAADAVERYNLGQNAYKSPKIHHQAVRAQSPQYADASFEIGRYKNGARILAPEEPARKVDRLQMEKLQAWNEENFGGGSGADDEHAAQMQSANYAPIDVGAVKPAPESRTSVQPIGSSDL